jgi:hypothetical protein
MVFGLTAPDYGQTILTLDVVQQMPKTEAVNRRCDMTLLRQGDILLIAIEALPHGAAQIPPVRCGGRLRHVLAVGEATGHAHTLLADDQVEFYRAPEPDHELTTGYLAIHWKRPAAIRSATTTTSWSTATRASCGRSRGSRIPARAG